MGAWVLEAWSDSADMVPDQSCECERARKRRVREFSGLTMPGFQRREEGQSYPVRARDFDQPAPLLTLRPKKPFDCSLSCCCLPCLAPHRNPAREGSNRLDAASGCVWLRDSSECCPALPLLPNLEEGRGLARGDVAGRRPEGTVICLDEPIAKAEWVVVSV